MTASHPHQISSGLDILHLGPQSGQSIKEAPSCTSQAQELPDSKGLGDRPKEKSLRTSKRPAKGKFHGDRREKAGSKRKSDWKDSNPSHPKSSRPYDHSDIDPAASDQKRLPKRKVAVLLGYYGKGYQGSQVNPGRKTIEGEVFKALVKAGCISQDNSNHPNKVGLQRAARTDANVHAGCNLISLKLILDPPGLKSQDLSSSLNPQLDNQQKTLSTSRARYLALINHINDCLPNEIRIWSLVRVQNSFHCRNLCDSRTYEYSLPTYLFLPPKPGCAMYERLNNIPISGTNKNWAECFQEGETEASWWSEHLDPLDSDYKASQMEKKSRYRISPIMINRIKQAIEKFKGTHNFHNFTVGKEFNDRSAIRIMKNLCVSEPFLVGSDDTNAPTEWISIKFHGQSFMLHQIRKMIGLVILTCRTRTPSNIIPEIYGPTKVGIPKAPGLGLILQHPHFDGYNKRVKETNQQLISQKKPAGRNEEELDDLLREPIDAMEVKDLIDGFKTQVLFKRMWEEERKEDAFGVWINYLDVYRESDLNFLNPNGELPPSLTSTKASHKSNSALNASSTPPSPWLVAGSNTDMARLIFYEDDAEEENMLAGSSNSQFDEG
ncbi:hypothetical protein O181_005249 [Austropuccinia psidii MF-1]|uniref:Pseudouridine synthase I TruA alpha/beta domain-containing protein n=1 Tax=Austropuccinia psidii MF-1 TaxID=1389203 RepID=A0A9Q3GFP6_9BASI|nr:hypothetical protein [Austropuccinia psidii MF-1]